MHRRNSPAVRASAQRAAKKIIPQGLTLDELLEPPATRLDVHSVDVRRLRDDRSPIEVGEEVMFVAAAKFRLETAGIEGTVDLEGTDVLEIRDDADLVSKLEVASEEVVQQQLQERFRFVFRLNGEPQTHYKPVADDPPWIFRYNTALYPTDYLKIEVDVIDEEPDAPPAEAVPGFDFLAHEQKQRASLTLHVPASRERRQFRIKLIDVESEEEQELLLELIPDKGRNDADGAEDEAGNADVRATAAQPGHRK
jgi:hypothetical protein